MLVLMQGSGVAQQRCSARRTAARRCLATAERFATAEAAEAFLLSAAGAVDEQAAAEAIRVLAADGGCLAPVDSPLIEGVWQLCFTSKSKFDIRNPLGARVDGSAPGLEALFRLGGGGEKATSILQASSSPIQRAVVSNPAFTVTQTVALRDTTVPVVDNTVSFGTAAELLLRASASLPETSDRRRIDFTVRRWRSLACRQPALLTYSLAAV